MWSIISSSCSEFVAAEPAAFPPHGRADTPAAHAIVARSQNVDSMCGPDGARSLRHAHPRTRGRYVCPGFPPLPTQRLFTRRALRLFGCFASHRWSSEMGVRASFVGVSK